MPGMHPHSDEPGNQRACPPTGSHAAPACELAPDASPLPPYTAVIDGQRLRQLRIQHGLSQENLAYRARIGRTALARLEHERRPRCRTRTLALLAVVLEEIPPPSPYWSGQVRSRPPRKRSARSRQRPRQDSRGQLIAIELPGGQPLTIQPGNTGYATLTGRWNDSM